MSSVEFVQDYIQLRFDGPCLTVNAPLTVEVGDSKVRLGSPGFCDALCQEIGKSVTKAELMPSDRLLVMLSNAVTLSVSLRDDEQVGPEAAVLSFEGDTIVF
jgi:hypothetical protein